jgi:short subunit fatty acids transporter
MSDHDLFTLCIVLIVVMSFFTGLVTDLTASFNVGGVLDAPNPWDVITFIGGGFWALMTFSIEGMPVFINLFFWLLSVIALWLLIRMIRGV